MLYIGNSTEELRRFTVFHCFVAQDIEQDSARLLSSGVFRTARPLVFPPRGSAETYPQVLASIVQASRQVRLAHAEMLASRVNEQLPVPLRRETHVHC